MLSTGIWWDWRSHCLSTRPFFDANLCLKQTFVRYKPLFHVFHNHPLKKTKHHLWLSKEYLFYLIKEEYLKNICSLYFDFLSELDDYDLILGIIIVLFWNIVLLWRKINRGGRKEECCLLLDSSVTEILGRGVVLMLFLRIGGIKLMAWEL